MGNLQLLVRYIVCNGDYVNTVIIASYVVSVDELLPAKANGGADNFGNGRRKQTAG